MSSLILIQKVNLLVVNDNYFSVLIFFYLVIDTCIKDHCKFNFLKHLFLKYRIRTSAPYKCNEFIINIIYILPKMFGYYFYIIKNHKSVSS